MKASASLAVAAILGWIFIVGCVSGNPPATSYEVGTFELQASVGNAQKVRGASVTPAFFESAKTPAVLGRSFLSREYGSGSQQVVMLSYRFWQQRFRGDPRIIGTTMRINGQAFTVVGIMPTTFEVPSGVDIWVPKAG